MCISLHTFLEISLFLSTTKYDTTHNFFTILTFWTKIVHTASSEDNHCLHCYRCGKNVKNVEKNLLKHRHIVLNTTWITYDKRINLLNFLFSSYVLSMIALDRYQVRFTFQNRIYMKVALHLYDYILFISNILMIKITLKSG